MQVKIGGDPLQKLGGKKKRDYLFFSFESFPPVFNSVVHLLFCFFLLDISPILNESRERATPLWLSKKQSWAVAHADQPPKWKSIYEGMVYRQTRWLCRKKCECNSVQSSLDLSVICKKAKQRSSSAMYMYALKKTAVKRNQQGQHNPTARRQNTLIIVSCLYRHTPVIVS